VAEELTFRLEDFEGPLELLLTLVQKHKMDLHNIPILEAYRPVHPRGGIGREHRP